ncbi:MAG TPA: VTT domain-containing protein [Dehalococcoidia bacterium]|nr:VTT domain-containing protein [Dehalococcoidia bacterium]
MNAEDAPDVVVQDDNLEEEAARAIALRQDSPLDRLVLRLSGWLAQHTLVRAALAGGLLVLVVSIGVVLLAAPDLADRLEGFGYVGVFLTNLASTATLFIPVPGLTAAGQTLIVSQGETHQPLLVGIAGGSGMALGEITAYYAGFLGAELARGREIGGPAWFRRGAERVVRAVNWLMGRWGMVTLFVLAAIPNPAFEVAGITAGSVRMPFKRFFGAVALGKIVRGIILAYLGDVFGLPFL